MDERSDDELMRLSGTDDHAAFAVLVERHLVKAGKLAARVVGNKAEGELPDFIFVRTVPG